MANVVVVTGPEAAVGFRLAGADVREIRNPKELDGVVSLLMRDKGTGIIAISDDYLPHLNPDLAQEIERTYRPIIIPIPAGPSEVGGMDYLERLIRRAIGTNIVVR